MIRLGKRLTIVQSDKGRLETVPLELMGPHWHAVGVSTNNCVVIFVVRAQKILWAFRTNKYIMCLKPWSQWNTIESRTSTIIPFRQLVHISYAQLVRRAESSLIYVSWYFARSYKPLTSTAKDGVKDGRARVNGVKAASDIFEGFEIDMVDEQETSYASCK